MPTNIGGTIVPDSASNVSSNVGSRAINFGTNTTTPTAVVQQQLASSNAFGGSGISGLNFSGFNASAGSGSHTVTANYSNVGTPSSWTIGGSNIGITSSTPKGQVVVVPAGTNPDIVSTITGDVNKNLGGAQYLMSATSPSGTTFIYQNPNTFADQGLTAEVQRRLVASGVSGSSGSIVPTPPPAGAIASTVLPSGKPGVILGRTSFIDQKDNVGSSVVAPSREEQIVGSTRNVNPLRDVPVLGEIGTAYLSGLRMAALNVEQGGLGGSRLAAVVLPGEAILRPFGAGVSTGSQALPAYKYVGAGGVGLFTTGAALGEAAGSVASGTVVPYVVSTLGKTGIVSGLEIGGKVITGKPFGQSVGETLTPENLLTTGTLVSGSGIIGTGSKEAGLGVYKSLSLEGGVFGAGSAAAQRTNNKPIAESTIGAAAAAPIFYGAGNVIASKLPVGVVEAITKNNPVVQALSDIDVGGVKGKVTTTDIVTPISDVKTSVRSYGTGEFTTGLGRRVTADIEGSFIGERMNVNSPLSAGGSAPMTYYEGTMTTNVGGKSVVTPVEGLGGIKSSSVKVPVLSGDELLNPSKVSNTILGVSGDQGVVGKIGQIRDIPPQIFEVSGKQVGSVPSTSGNILLVDTPLGKKAFTADVSYYATKTKPFADAELILGSAKMQRVGIDVSTPVLGTGYTQVGTIDTGLTGRAKVFDFGKIEFPEFVRTSKPSTSDVTVVGRQIRLTGFAFGDSASSLEYGTGGGSTPSGGIGKVGLLPGGVENPLTLKETPVSSIGLRESVGIGKPSNLDVPSVTKETPDVFKDTGSIGKGSGGKSSGGNAVGRSGTYQIFRPSTDYEVGDVLVSPSDVQSSVSTALRDTVGADLIRGVGRQVSVGSGRGITDSFNFDRSVTGTNKLRDVISERGKLVSIDTGVTKGFAFDLSGTKSSGRIDEVTSGGNKIISIDTPIQDPIPIITIGNIPPPPPPPPTIKEFKTPPPPNDQGFKFPGFGVPNLPSNVGFPSLGTGSSGGTSSRGTRADVQGNVRDLLSISGIGGNEVKLSKARSPRVGKGGIGNIGSLRI